MSLVLSAREGALVRLTINRPEERNVIHTPLAGALLRELEAANASDARAVLLDASGPVFCAGGDSDLPLELFRFRQWMRLPVVCGVQGAVLGPGFALLANAHVVVAAQGTSFGLTEVRAGAWPIGFHSIAAAIGERRALELSLTGRVFGAPEALQIGLVHELAPAFEFDDRAEALACHLASLQLDGRLPAT